MKYTYCILWMCLSTLMSCSSQTTNNQGSDSITQAQKTPIDSTLLTIKSSVDRHAQEFLKDSIIHAVSVGVFYKGKTVSSHYGELDKGQGNLPNDQTMYEIASVTKTFTGTLAAKAVLEKKLNLEDDIRQYLAGQYPNLAYKKQPIRIKHLLTHTSGLPANTQGIADIPTNLSWAERTRKVQAIEKKQTKKMFFQALHQVEIKTLPGTHFNYSNFGTNLMGAILEKVYKKPFQELIRDEIIAKAAMKNTKFHLNNEEKKRLASGYDEQGNLMPHLTLESSLWGAEGALKSTISDLLKYVQFQINEKNLIAKEAHKKIKELDKNYWVGYFWWIIGAQGKNLHFRHDGGAPGTRNVLLIYPESKIGISVVTNVVGPQIFDQLSKLGKRIYHDLKKQ